jgi:RHS repeat-associated protein
MLPAAQINMLPMAQLLLLKEAVDAASEQWEREQAERREREAEEGARREAVEAKKSRQAKPKQAKNPPPVFPFFWWELASGTSVHMNGRIYDPLLGRMLSADPHIQSPTNLQNYNRYSYVTNNPLSMTDPSGFFFKKLFKKVAKFFKKFATAIVSAALAAIVIVASFGTLTPLVGAYWAGVISAGLGGFTLGFTSTLLNGGTLSQALTAGAITGALAAAAAGIGLSGGNFSDINVEQYSEFTQRLGEYSARASRIYSRIDNNLPQQDGETDNYKWENGAGSGSYSYNSGLLGGRISSIDFSGMSNADRAYFEDLGQRSYIRSDGTIGSQIDPDNVVWIRDNYSQHIPMVTSLAAKGPAIVNGGRAVLRAGATKWRSFMNLMTRTPANSPVRTAVMETTDDLLVASVRGVDSAAALGNFSLQGSGASAGFGRQLFAYGLRNSARLEVGETGFQFINGLNGNAPNIMTPDLMDFAPGNLFFDKNNVITNTAQAWGYSLSGSSQ